MAVKVDGMPLKPFAGLGAWAAFTPTKQGAMVMGDTVVFQDEVTPSYGRRFRWWLGSDRTTQPFLFDEPKVYFMHVGGEGEPEKMATAIKNVWDAIKKVRAKNPSLRPSSPVIFRRPGRLPLTLSRRSFGKRENLKMAWSK